MPVCVCVYRFAGRDSAVRSFWNARRESSGWRIEGSLRVLWNEDLQIPFETLSLSSLQRGLSAAVRSAIPRNRWSFARKDWDSEVSDEEQSLETSRIGPSTWPEAGKKILSGDIAYQLLLQARCSSVGDNSGLCLNGTIWMVRSEV